MNDKFDTAISAILVLLALLFLALVIAQAVNLTSGGYSLIMAYNSEGQMVEEWVVESDITKGLCLELLKDYPSSDDGRVAYYCGR